MAGILLAGGIGSPRHLAHAQGTRSQQHPGEPFRELLRERLPAASATTLTTLPTPTALDSLVAIAVARHPLVRAARARVDAARARVSVAGARPDPMLMAGIQNLPLGSTRTTAGGMTSGGGPDPMTMHMIGVSQTIPYPGKLALSRAAAEHEVAGATAALDAAVHQVTHDVQDAYAELVFLDDALDVVRRNHDVLDGFVRTADARYRVGTGAQADLLQARVEETRLAETASTLTEQRHAALARLNALLDRPDETPLPRAALPPRIVRAAIAPLPDTIRFTSTTLGARVAASPLPTVEELQRIALRQSPALREQAAMIDAQASRVALARKAHLPDIDVSVQYGQRGGGLPDMISATVAVPLPLSRQRKQEAEVADAGAQLAALQGDRAAQITAMRTEIARLVAELEHERTQLALYVTALLPQGRATVTSTLAGYSTGKTEFRTVLDAQSTVFTYEIDYARALSDFARNVASLEQLVGQEVLR